VSQVTCCDSIENREVVNLDESTAPDNLGESDATQSMEWAPLVERIRTGDASAMQELYQVFGRGVRHYLCRQLGMQDVDDKIHDTFLVVVQAIQKGDLREPDRLMGFVRTIARRMVAAHIDQMVHRRRDNVAVDSGIAISDKRTTPEENVIGREKVDIMLGVLRSMSARDRDILTRFYLYEQTQETICHEMNLTSTQFRLLKSRAKNRFSELGKKKLSETRNSLRTFTMFLH
jgi:RNA polymerase sigma-70 factor (ECF subfamily)